MRIRGVKRFASAVGLLLGLLCAVEAAKVNKHKPWIETTYHGIVTENDDKVLLDPPLIALDKDAPLRYAAVWVEDADVKESTHVTSKSYVSSASSRHFLSVIEARSE